MGSSRAMSYGRAPVGGGRTVVVPGAPYVLAGTEDNKVVDTSGSSGDTPIGAPPGMQWGTTEMQTMNVDSGVLAGVGNNQGRYEPADAGASAGPSPGLSLYQQNNMDFQLRQQQVNAVILNNNPEIVAEAYQETSRR